MFSLKPLFGFIPILDLPYSSYIFEVERLHKDFLCLACMRNVAGQAYDFLPHCSSVGISNGVNVEIANDELVAAVRTEECRGLNDTKTSRVACG